QNNVGCEYYGVYFYQNDVDIYHGPAHCYAAFVANTWSTPVTISVEFGDQKLDVSQFARIPNGAGASQTYDPLPNGVLPPNQVAVLFLSSSLAGFTSCPAPGANMQLASQADLGPHRNETATGKKAFRITASAPVVAYDMFPYNYANINAGSA